MIDARVHHGRQVAEAMIDTAKQCDDGGLAGSGAVEIAHVFRRSRSIYSHFDYPAEFIDGGDAPFQRWEHHGRSTDVIRNRCWTLRCLL